MSDKCCHNITLLVSEGRKNVGNGFFLCIGSTVCGMTNDRFTEIDNTFFAQVFTMRNDGINCCSGVCTNCYKTDFTDISMSYVSAELVNIIAKMERDLRSPCITALRASMPFVVSLNLQ